MGNAETIESYLRLRKDSSGLHASLIVSPLIPEGQISSDAFVAFIGSHDVVASAINSEAIDELIESLKSKPGVEQEAVVASATPASPPTPAALTWADEIQSQIAAIQARVDAVEAADSGEGPAPTPLEADEADSGATDFYNQSAFLVVTQGETLGSIQPGTEGIDGVDLEGQCIAAPTSDGAAPWDDESFEIDEENRLVARLTGRLRFELSTPRIEETLILEEGVDFRTGNIRFPGPVLISGGIEDRFEADAGGEIAIDGLVGAGIVRSETKVRLIRGMAGRESGKIFCTGPIEAGYLESCQATGEDDITVKSEITNCQISVHGLVSITDGPIRGGSVTAAKGVVAKTVGNDLSTPTEIVVGRVDTLCDKMQRLSDMIEEAESELEKRTAAMTQFDSVIGKPTPKQVEEKMELEFAVREMSERIEQLNAANERIQRIFLDSIHPDLTVQAEIHRGTSVFMPGFKAVVEKKISGPCTIRIQAGKEPILDHKGSSGPLSEHAKVTRDDRVPRLPEPPAVLDGSQLLGDDTGTSHAA